MLSFNEITAISNQVHSRASALAEDDDEFDFETDQPEFMAHYTHDPVPRSFFLKNMIVPGVVLLGSVMSTLMIIKGSMPVSSGIAAFILLTLIAFTHGGRLFKAHGNNYNATVFILSVTGVVSISLVFMAFNLLVAMLLFNA